MTMDAENRKEDRFSCSCRARHSIFGQSVFHDSQIVDFSDSGMRLKSSIPGTVGATVLVQATPQPSDVQARSGFRCPTNRSIGLGEVRWCERLEHGAGKYHLGLKLHSL
ncbi:MAG: PilZ domain-containing protein [Desulfobacterales bacterium]|nr:PilZ domain-containing protein [Desulfobacterales bacterium]